MYATVNQQACIRCGLCPGICPAVFHLPDNGDSAQAISGEIPTEQQADAQAAADSCPTGAIVIR